MGFDFCWFLPFLGKVSFNISRPYETERFIVQYKQVIFLKHQCLSSASSVHRRERRHHRHHQHQQHHHEDHHDHQGASGQVIFSKHQCLSSASFVHSKHWQLQKFKKLLLGWIFQINCAPETPPSARTGTQTQSAENWLGIEFCEIWMELDLFDGALFSAGNPLTCHGESSWSPN